MNDSVKTHQRDWIHSLLKARVCEVIFEKVDGSERTMLCTLREDYLPESQTKTTNKKPNTDVIPVWDIESKGWRSFRVDKVVQVTEANIKD
tara:strand:+ start:187 stop:459 length:273 start_codon:yes stop_codon:yes gene_type:complete